jgi:hypothetical protein
VTSRDLRLRELQENFSTMKSISRNRNVKCLLLATFDWCVFKDRLSSTSLSYILTCFPVSCKPACPAMRKFLQANFVTCNGLEVTFVVVVVYVARDTGASYCVPVTDLEQDHMRCYVYICAS